MDKFIVTPEHGRVFRPVSPGLRVLVAIPGDEIPIEVAEQLEDQSGKPLVKKAKPKAAAVKKSTVKKAAPTKPTPPSPAPVQPVKPAQPAKVESKQSSSKPAASSDD